MNYCRKDFTCITPSLIKISNTLIKLVINGGCQYLSFIAKFTNLQELILSLNNFIDVDSFGDFNTLHHVTFSKLRILKFEKLCPKHEDLSKFLGNNGRNLNVLHINTDNNNLDIIKFCPNLKSLRTVFSDDKVETLKVILNGCQQLESNDVLCGSGFLNENELLKVVAEYSPKTFYEVKIDYTDYKGFFLGELEPVFISWANRIPQKPLSLIITCGGSDCQVKKENMEVIENFKKLGVIEKFEIIRLW